MPVPLFLLMGEVLFRSGLAARLMDVLDAWLGRVPGRLSLMAVAGGTLFATLAGSGAATTALLGRILVPDMREARLQAADDPRPDHGFRRARGDDSAICARRHPGRHRRTSRSASSCLPSSCPA